ncbi:calcium-binding protein CML13 [Phytophthora cinnamomi]|uniref:calcium-binding protein CML13 n=1 Tax=Phytophthora cinnamomi TaxID=4785 RepID=UPI00355A715D|nr:calcium-binding protein CML13 [Phytophthora cinnamomi]
MTSNPLRSWRSAALRGLGFAVLLFALVIAQVTEKSTPATSDGQELEAAGAEGEKAEGELEADGGRVAIVAAVTISTLVAISILFEVSTDQLKEHTDELNMPFVNTVFGELTTLGFIGLLLFVVTKIQVLPWLSRNVLGESAELQEIIEKLHMALFFFIVIFLVLCLGLLRLGMHVQHEWREFERSCADIPSVLSEYALATEPPKSWLERLSWHRADAARKAEREVVYLALRRRFMDYRSNHPDEETARQLAKEFQLQGDDTRFPFSEYLSIISGEVMGRLIQIDMATWIALDIVLVVILCLCWHSGPRGEVAILLASGFALIALNDFVYRRVNAMRCLLTPPQLQTDAERLRRKSVWRAQHGLPPLSEILHSEKTWLLADSEEAGRDYADSHGWAPPYVELLPNGGRDLSEKELKIHQRSLIGAGWGNGVLLTLFSTRLVFLLTALHLSTFLLRETYQISDLFGDHPAFAGLLCFFFLIPSIAVPFMSTRIARDGLLAFNVEHMKVSRVIVQVTRLLRARQTLRTLRFVAEMKIHLRESARRNSQQLKLNIELMPEVPMPVPSRRRSSIMPIDASASFKAARRRSSSQLDPTVTAGVLRSIQNVPPPLTFSPKATVATEPPLSPLAAYLSPREKRGDAYRREMERREIHTIFCLFDVDGSGSVSREEMASLLLAITHDLDDMQLNRLMTDLVAEELDSDDESLRPDGAMVEGPQEITFEAFYKWCSSRIQESRHSKEELVEEIFHMVDADGSGTISVDEFVSIFKTLGQALDHDDVRELVYQMDRNGDGKIDLEEFSKMLQKHEV